MDDELLEAVERGDLKQARALLEAGGKPHVDEWGLSLVDEALARRDEQMVPLLVKFGARLDEMDGLGKTRLHRAASASGEPALTSLLLRLDPIPMPRTGTAGPPFTSRGPTATRTWRRC